MGRVFESDQGQPVVEEDCLGPHLWYTQCRVLALDPSRRVGGRSDGGRRRQGGDAPRGDRRVPGANGPGDAPRHPRLRARQGRRPRGRTGGRDHGRQEDLGADPALPPPADHQRRRRLRARRSRSSDPGDGPRDGANRRRDGGADGGGRRRPHRHRHGEGDGAGSVARGGAPAREEWRQERGLETPTAWVITVSDRCAAGEAEDRSGPAVARLLEDAGFEVIGRQVIPDEVDEIRALLREAGGDLVVTTGGTGPAPRDVTPQATAQEIDFAVPGPAEEMRPAGGGPPAAAATPPRPPPAPGATAV